MYCYQQRAFFKNLCYCKQHISGEQCNCITLSYNGVSPLKNNIEFMALILLYNQDTYGRMSMYYNKQHRCGGYVFYCSPAHIRSLSMYYVLISTHDIEYVVTSSHYMDSVVPITPMTRIGGSIRHKCVSQIFKLRVGVFLINVYKRVLA